MTWSRPAVRVVVIDPDDDLRGFLCRILRSYYRVQLDVFPSYTEGLSFLEKHGETSLVVVDHDPIDLFPLPFSELLDTSSNPYLCRLPILGFARLESPGDTEKLRAMGYPFTIRKPMLATRFIEVFRKALAARIPSDDEGVARVFDQWVSQRHYRRAERLMRSQFRIDPNSLKCKVKFANYLFFANRMDEAEEMAKSVIESHPMNEEAVHTLSRIYAKTGDHDRALDILEDFKQKKGSDEKIGREEFELIQARPFNNHGLVAAREGKWDIAISCYDEALKRLGDGHPKRCAVLYNTVRAHLEVQDLEVAHGLAGEAVSLEPEKEKKFLSLLGKYANAMEEEAYRGTGPDGSSSEPAEEGDGDAESASDGEVFHNKSALDLLQTQNDEDVAEELAEGSESVASASEETAVDVLESEASEREDDCEEAEEEGEASPKCFFDSVLESQDADLGSGSEGDLKNFLPHSQPEDTTAEISDEGKDESAEAAPVVKMPESGADRKLTAKEKRLLNYVMFKTDKVPRL